MADEKVIKIVTEADARAYDFGSQDRSSSEPQSRDLQSRLERSLESFIDKLDKQTDALQDKIDEEKSEVLSGVSSISHGKKVRRIISGRKQGRPSEKSEEEESGPDSWYVSAVKKMQKVVTAFEGTNGRATKGLAVLRRSLEGIDKAYAKHDKTVVDTTRKTIEVAEIQNDEVVRVTKTLGKTAGNASISLLRVVKAAGVFAAATAAAGFAASILSRGIESLQEVVGKFSGALIAAQANTKVAEIQERMKSANRVGGDLASMESTNQGLKLELIRLKTELIDLLAPAIDTIGGVLIGILKVCNAALTGLNLITELIEKIIEAALGILEHIPIIGGAAKTAKEWMMKEDIAAANQSDKIHKPLDDIFTVDIGVDKFGKPVADDIKRDFLPKAGF